MKKETALLEFEDLELLKTVIENYNQVYRNSSRRCVLKTKSPFEHEIEITDDGQLLPYGIFEIGRHIGYQLMYKNYRIRLTGWKQNFHQTIFESENHPVEESVFLTLENNEAINFKIKKATGYDSEIETVMPFISQSDFEEISTFSLIQIIRHLHWTEQKTQRGLRINYLITGKYLLIFGVDLRYGQNYYRIDLESVYEITKPENDF